MKRCGHCKLELSLEKFYKNKTNYDGLCSGCKDCFKQYYQENKDRIIEVCKQYRKENKQKIWLYKKNKILTNIQYKLATRLRTRLNKAIKRNQKHGSSVKDLGCSIPELKIYLEHQFQEGMTWDNYGEWHIDHKIPLKSFDLTNREQFLRAVNYTNLQPLWAFDNIIKGCKINF